MAKYSKGKTARKAGKEGTYATGAAMVASAAIGWARNHGAPWPPDADLYLVGTLAGFIAGAVKAGRNYVAENGLPFFRRWF